MSLNLLISSWNGNPSPIDFKEQKVNHTYTLVDIPTYLYNIECIGKEEMSYNPWALIYGRN